VPKHGLLLPVTCGEANTAGAIRIIKKSSRHTQYQVSDFTLFWPGSGKDRIRFGAGFARPQANAKLGASFKAYYRDIQREVEYVACAKNLTLVMFGSAVGSLYWQSCPGGSDAKANLSGPKRAHVCKFCVEQRW
jgi:hypothetical protein